MIITGMSGAGRTQAANALEDLGWFVIDNLPPSLVPQVGSLALAEESAASGEGIYGRVALVIGVHLYQGEIGSAVAELRELGVDVRVLYLDATDATLIRRYENTRRRHPLGEAERVADAIQTEREMLTDVRGEADVVIDTTDLNVHELRDRVVSAFGHPEGDPKMRIAIMSFGFKHRTPTDADVMFDCRFLPNPHWVPELRPQSGLDEAVAGYVFERDETKQFIDNVEPLIEMLIPAYIAEGKSYLTIAFGCTGGRHRAVALAEHISNFVSDLGYEALTTHRDIDK